jgi:adenylate cyclase
MQGGADLEVPISSLYITVGYVLLGVLVAQTQRMLREDFTRLRRLSNLKRFLPSQIAERVYQRGDEALSPVSREVTVMFTDIRDFTAQSERMEPREVLRFLDDYFGHMSQIVRGHDGVVSKFIGDGMLAFWGVPEANPKHAEGALRAALDMRKKLVELNAARANEGLTPIHIGVGVHTGVVAAGLLGRADAPLSEYTVIGDAVNLASRIEGLNKKLGTDLLVSEETFRAAGDRFDGQLLGEEHVKGRERPVVLYRVDGVRPAAT